MTKIVEEMLQEIKNFSAEHEVTSAVYVLVAEGDEIQTYLSEGFDNETLLAELLLAADDVKDALKNQVYLMRRNGE